MGQILTLTPNQWQELQTNESIVINGITYPYDENNLYMVVECPFPEGYVYISTEKVSPAGTFGGSWEELPEGYALWTAASEGGQIIEAGLPNITGTGIYGFDVGDKAENQPTGAVRIYEKKDTNVAQGSSWKKARFSIDASLGETKEDGTIQNDVYGKSDTVQPPAYKVYAWKRVP